MRRWLVCLVVAALLCGSFGLFAQGRKNVLVLVADDYRAAAGAYGNPVTRTPSIDALASHGVRFDRAYCQYPVCNPSRTSFLSGLRPETIGVLDGTTLPRAHKPDIVFLPQYFRQHGYFTARVGKIFHASRFLQEDGKPYYDFDDPASWEVSISEITMLPNRLQQIFRGKPGEKVGDEGALVFEKLDVPEDQTGDGIVTREAIALLEKHAGGGKPYFLAAGFRRPHLPWWTPRKYFDLYPPAAMQLPFSPEDDLADIPPIALTKINRLTETEKREFMAAYYASVSFMDAGVGRVLAALDRLKLRDSTIVVFLSDHGYHLGEHQGLWQKMTVFEECTRTPLIVDAPGKRHGAVATGIVELVDLYPTLSELCGLPIPAGLEGTSFARLLDHPAQQWKRAAFSIVHHKQVAGRSVRGERYRYTEWGDAGTAELYDLKADPHEFTNVARDPKHAAALAEMRGLLQTGWRGALPRTRPAASSGGH
jgi:iduronate 2-sulfatase